MYFESNLPAKAPEHVTNKEAKERINRILSTIRKRMNKLEKALISTGLPGEQFAAGAKILFDQMTETGEPLLDTMTPSKVAKMVSMMAPTLKWEKRMEWPNAIVVVDTAFLTTTEWEAVRVIGIGGSDAAVTLDVSPYRTEQMLYYDKVCKEYKIPDEDSGKEFIFTYGHKLESLVIEEFCRRSGARVIPETRMFAHKEKPYITANIDAILILPSGEICLYEAKTTTSFNKDAWEDNHVPVQYVPQCRQYMGVLDDPRVTKTFIGCIYGNTPNDFVCSCIKRDLDKERAQFETETEFWNDYVLAGVEPPPSGDSEKDIAVARRLSGFADKDLPEIVLDNFFKAIIEEYLALGAERSSLESKADGIKTRQNQLSLDLIKALGQATAGKLLKDEDNYYAVSYSPRSRKSVDFDKLRMLYPDAYNSCVTVNPESSRVFSIKEKKLKKGKKKSAVA